MATDSTSPFDSDASEGPLDRAILEFLRAQEAGVPVDVPSFLKKHAEIADELDSFIHQQLQMGRLMSPVRRITELAKPDSTAFTHFGDYKIIREVGCGGMGVIYEAQQQGLKRRVALKMIRENRFLTEESLIRFQAEAEAAAALDHANIVPVYRVGNVEGRPFFTMKLVRGGSLKERLAEGPLPSKEAARMARLIADAVNFAHQHGILHRDLKPANILLDQRSNSDSSTNFSTKDSNSTSKSNSDSNSPDTNSTQNTTGADTESLSKKSFSPIGFDGSVTPMISDFGLAKQMGDEKTHGLTMTGAVLGTPSFMSPEQANGEVSLTTATDIYGVGAILFNMVTGKPPFEGTTPGEITRKVIEQSPSLNGQSTNIDDDLKTICLKCLEKDPSDRYESAAELSQDLQRFVDGRPILARRASPLEQTIKWSRRNPLLASLLGAVAALLFLAAIGSFVFSLKLNNEVTKRGIALEKLQLEESKTAAQRDQALRLLFESKFQEVAARRSSGESGHRLAALKAAEEAVSQSEFIDVTDKELFELRSETAGCLGNLDLLETGNWSSMTYQKAAIAFTRDLKLCASHPVRTGPLYIHSTDDLTRTGSLENATPVASFDLGKNILSGPFRCKFSDCGSYVFASTIDSQGVLTQFVFDLKNKSELLKAKNVTHACYGNMEGVPVIASATANEISIRRLPDLEPIATFPNPSSGTNNLLSFSPDGNWLIRHGVGGLVVFDLANKKISTQIAGGFFDLSWHPTELEFAVTDYLAANIWRLEKGQISLLAKFPKHTHKVFQVEYSHDGSVLATSTWNGNTRFWDVESGEQLFSSVGAINQFSNNGTQVAMSGAKISIFRYEGQRLRKTITPSDEKTEAGQPQDLDVHPGNRWIAVSDNKSIQIGDLHSATKLIDLPGTGRLRFHPNGDYLLSSGSGAVVKWPFSETKLPNGKPRLTVGPPSNLLTVNAQMGMDLDPDGKYIGVISGNAAQVVPVDDVGSVVQMKSEQVEGFLNGISMSRSRRLVAVGNHHGREVQVFDGRTGDLVRSIATPTTAVCKISPDGDLLAITFDNTAEVYETESWQRLYSLRESEFEVAWPASFSDDGKRLLLTLRQPRGTLILNARTGQNLIRIPGDAGTAPLHAGPVLTSNQQVVMIREGNSVESWDLASIRKQLGTIGLDWTTSDENLNEQDNNDRNSLAHEPSNVTPPNRLSAPKYAAMHKPEIAIDWGQTSRLAAYQNLLQRIYRGYGKHSAEIAFQNWRKNYPDDAVLWKARGQVHRQNGNRQCIADWEKALSCKDCDSDVYVSRAVAGILFNQRDHVAADLKTFLGEESDPSFARMRAARLLAWELGLNLQNRDLPPSELKSAMTFAATAKNWFANADPSEASEAKNYSVQHTLAIKALALIHIRDNNPNAAIELLKSRELIQANSDTSIAYGLEFLLGLAYASAGKEDLAREQYEKGLKNKTQVNSIESFRAVEWLKFKSELETALEISRSKRIRWTPIELAGSAGWDIGTVQVQFVPDAFKFNGKDFAFEKTDQKEEHLLWSAGSDGHLTLNFYVEQSGSYDVAMELSRARSFGIFNFSINGQPVGTKFDGYFDASLESDSTNVVFGDRVELKDVRLVKGKNKLVVGSVGRSAKASAFQAGIESLELIKR